MQNPHNNNLHKSLHIYENDGFANFALVILFSDKIAKFEIWKLGLSMFYDNDKKI